jgi:putative oxidoreductase
MTDSTQSLVQALGRILMCPLFVMGGYNKAIDPAVTAAMMARVGTPLPYLIATLAIVIELGGGALLLIGLFTRPVALALGVWCIATALVAHTHWADRNMELHFWKNVAIAGGFAYVAAFGAGALSLDVIRSRRRLAVRT